MKFKRVKKWLALGLAVTMLMSTPLMASAAGLKDLFNAKFYADTYADLKDAFGYDEDALYNHFLTYGLKEGRNMNPVLDVIAYRDAYGDLQEAFGDNWDAYVEHFLTYGVYETNRREGVMLDPIEYLESYGDLKEAFGDDILAAIQHYQDHGYQEKRTEGTANGYSSIAEAKRAEEQAAAAAATATTTTAQQPLVEKEYNASGYMVIEYDAAGNVIKRTFKSYDGTYGYVETYTYNSNNDITDYWQYYEDKDNRTYHTVTSYDAQGREAKVTKYGSNGTIENYGIIEWSSDTESTRVNYDGEGNKLNYIVRKHDAQKNIIASTVYSTEGKLLSSTTTTYNDKKKVLTSKSYDADGVLRSSDTNTYFANGRLKENSYVSTFNDWNYSSAQTYDEDGYMTSSSYAYPGYSYKSTYEYYTGGPVKKMTSEEKGKNYEDKEYTTVSVTEYSDAGIRIKDSYKTTYADGTVYGELMIYNSEGRVTHQEYSDGTVTDCSYYASGALKQVSCKYSNGNSDSTSYSDAGSYLDDWQERQKYRVASTWCNSDGKDKGEITYNADGSYVKKTTFTDNEGSEHVSVDTYDAQNRRVKNESGGYVTTYTYYESGALKQTLREDPDGSSIAYSYSDAGSYLDDWQAQEKYLSSYTIWKADAVETGTYYESGALKQTLLKQSDGYTLTTSYRDAGSYLSDWQERKKYRSASTEVIADGSFKVETVYHEDGSYTSTTIYSDGSKMVKEFDANDNEIVPDTPAQGSVSDGDAVQGG